MAGRKPELDNVYYLPGVSQVTSEQIAKADELKPDWLVGGAGSVWDRLGPQMMFLGRLKNYYVDAFAEYCYLLNRIAETRKHLLINGETYEVIGRNGAQIKSMPQVAQLNDDWRKLSQLTSKFGLTPSDEKTLLNTVQGDLVNEFGDYT